MALDLLNTAAYTMIARVRQGEKGTVSRGFVKLVICQQLATRRNIRGIVHVPEYIQQSSEEFGGQTLVNCVRQSSSIREGIFVSLVWHLDQCLTYNLIMADKGKFPHWISGLGFSLTQERGYQEKEFPRNREAGCHVSIVVADQDSTVNCGILLLELGFNRKNGKGLRALIQILISRCFFKDIEFPYIPIPYMLLLLLLSRFSRV